MLKVGDRIAKYLITAKLGEGGMGVVFAAKHEALGRDVAVKILLAIFAQRSDLMDRFFREAEAVSQIGHPNIVAVYDFGKLDDGSPYYVMERVAGETFKQRVRREPPMTRDEIASIFTQICRALGATHERGITHRDLKPDNVLLQSQASGPPHVKVLDYGIAKVRETAANPALTEAGDVLGTPAYMAPEQVEAAQLVDGRADLYSLGAMLYEVYAGAPPFVGEPMKVMIAHMDSPVPPIPEGARGLTPSINAFIMRALEKKPADRFANAAEFAREMQRALGIAVTAAPAPAPTPTSRATPSATLQSIAPTVNAPAATAAVPTARPARRGLLVGVSLAALVVIALAIVGYSMHRQVDVRLAQPALPTLEKLVSDPSPATRRKLATLLGEFPSPTAATAIATLIGDDDPEVRRAAALSSSEIPLTRDPSNAIGAALATAEERSGGQIAIDILLARVLRDPNVAFGPLEAIGTQLDAISFLRLTEARVARGQVPVAAVGRALLQANAASHRDRWRALRQLAADPAGHAVLDAIAADTARPNEWRTDAELALGKTSPVASLADAAAPIDARIAAIAAARPDDAPMIRQLANDADDRVRMAAIIALRVFSDAETPR